jgi:signal transduction histidine kinase
VLDNFKIRYKLIALVLLPIAALVIFATVGWKERSDTASKAQRDAQIVAAASATKNLVSALNAEGTITVAGLAPKAGAFDPKLSDQLVAQRKKTDAAFAAFVKANDALNLAPDSTAGIALAAAKSSYTGLKTERAQIGTGGFSGQDWSYEVTNFKITYNQKTYISYIQTLAGATTTPEVVLPLEQLRAYLDYSNSSVAVGNLAVGVIAQGGWATKSTGTAQNADGSDASNSGTFGTVDGAKATVLGFIQQQSIDNAVLSAITGEGSGTLWDRANNSVTPGDSLGQVLNTWQGTTDPANLSLPSSSSSQNVADITTDLLNYNAQYVKIGNTFVDQLTHDINTRRSDAKRASGLYVLFAGIVVLVALLLVYVMGRSVWLGLHKLTVAADRLSHEQLPRLVDSLKNPAEDDVGYLTSSFTDIDVAGSDEIGHLATAFNRIQGVAVEVATEQAQLLRKGIGDMFVNLARRNQGLLDRQIEFIDQLESAEEDPDQLENLFRLDHLATRMRRNAESLLVLAGAEPNRRRGKPVPLADVVRAAVGEVEDFARIDMLQFDEVLVASNAALDIAHLLSELMENAANFSPPDSRVEVVGHRTKAEGYVISVADHGIGMTAEQLAEANDLLARPPLVGLALSRSLGFIVIGRLAARFGIAVRLMPSPSGGTTAMVSLPPSLITDQPRSTSGPGAIPTTTEEPLPSAPDDASSLLDKGDGRPPARRRGASDPPKAERSTKSPPAAPNGAALAADARAAETRAPKAPTGAKQARRPAAPKTPEMSPAGADANGATSEAPPAAVSANGLTKRVPRSAGGQRAVPGGDGERSATQNRRSPDEVRSMLSRYRSGIQKGRGEDAGAQPSEDTEK